MSDIEAMYNQVAVPVRDRDFLRFVWFDERGDIAHYRTTRHLLEVYGVRVLQLMH